MKIPAIILGDIHGLNSWKQIVAANPNCRYIFLGDYLDPFEEIAHEVLLSNLQEIVELKKNNPDNVILLLGNHDMHYITSDMEPCLRFDMDIFERAIRLFISYLDLFQFAFQYEKYIFTHAGISQDWFINDFHGDTNKHIAEQLNNPVAGQSQALCQISEHYGGDEGTLGGIFFAHLQELHEPLHGYTQIVGHYHIDEISEYKTENASVIFCDCLWNGQYLRIDEQDKFVIKKVT